MTKSELIEIITAKQKHLPAKDVELALKQILEIMSDALSAGDRIEIRGFGSFSLHFRPPRQGRHAKSHVEARSCLGKAFADRWRARPARHDPRLGGHRESHPLKVDFPQFLDLEPWQQGSFHFDTALPGSKSLTLRDCAIAALADGASTIRFPGEADDYWRMKDCLRRLGIAVDDSPEDAVRIAGRAGQFGTGR